MMLSILRMKEARDTKDMDQGTLMNTVMMRDQTLHQNVRSHLPLKRLYVENNWNLPSSMDPYYVVFYFPIKDVTKYKKV